MEARRPQEAQIEPRRPEGAKIEPGRSQEGQIEPRRPQETKIEPRRPLEALIEPRTTKMPICLTVRNFLGLRNHSNAYIRNVWELFGPPKSPKCLYT